MRKVVAVLVAVVFALAAVGVAAQEKKQKAAKEDRLSGMVEGIDKDASKMTVRKGNVRKTVIWNNDTKWTKGTDKAELEDFKDGDRVICMGKFDDKGNLVATRIDLRAPKYQ